MPKPTRSETYRALIRAESPGFRNYFFGVPRLLTGTNANLPAALADKFHLIETAHHRVLYGCLCRMHDANSVISRKAVDVQHMTRPKFRELFKNVIGKEIPDPILAMSKSAEDFRDKALHGKGVSDAELWSAIQSLTRYAIELNKFVKGEAHFEAFGDMRGVVGRRGGTPLSQQTTRWLLKGMGFDLS